jgi:hypothetical protein
MSLNKGLFVRLMKALDFLMIALGCVKRHLYVSTISISKVRYSRQTENLDRKKSRADDNLKQCNEAIASIKVLLFRFKRDFLPLFMECSKSIRMYF